MKTLQESILGNVEDQVKNLNPLYVTAMNMFDKKGPECVDAVYEFFNAIPNKKKIANKGTKTGFYIFENKNYFGDVSVKFCWYEKDSETDIARVDIHSNGMTVWRIGRRGKLGYIAPMKSNRRYLYDMYYCGTDPELKRIYEDCLEEIRKIRR